jgi:hypothetical protein
VARDLKAKIRLEADTKQADKALKGSTEKIGKLDKSSKSLATSVTGLSSKFVAMGASLGVLAIGFSKLIGLANQEEDAIRKLDAAIGNLSGNNQALSDSLQKQADALAAVTKSGNEEILAVQARIALFIKEEDQIKALTIASLDMAAAKDRNATEVADALVRSIVTENNALLEQGIVIEGAAGSVERYSSALEGLTVFEGQAASAAQTTSGRISLAGDAFNDLAQEVTLTFTSLATFGKGMNALTGFVNKASAGVKFLRVEVGDLAVALAVIAESILPEWAAGLLGVDGATRSLLDSQQALRVERRKQEAESKAASDQLTKEKERVQELDRAAKEFRETEEKLIEEYRLRQDAAEDVTGSEEALILVTDRQAQAVANLAREEERLTQVIVSGSEARRAARSQENAENVLGGISTFAQIGGGTFFSPGGVVTEQNGRVSFLGSGPSGAGVSASG